MIYQGMLGFNGWEFAPSELGQVTRESLLITVITVIAVLVVSIEPFATRKRPAQRPRPYRGRAPLQKSLAIWTTPGVLLMGAFAVLKLAEQSFSPFLYFQF